MTPSSLWPAGLARAEIFCGSWNAGNAPPDTDLSAWIPWGGQEGRFDIVAVGFQEAQYRTTSRVFSSDGCAADVQADLSGLLQYQLGNEYDLVRSHSLGEMRLFVFCKVSLRRLITEVDTGQEATGFAHVMANKGGVAISLRFGGVGVCFVCAHLAAHQGASYTAARNDNVSEIVQGCRPGDPRTDVLNQFHHVFWLGDLNYRVDLGATEDDLYMGPSRAIMNIHSIDHNHHLFEEDFRKDGTTEDSMGSGTPGVAGEGGDSKERNKASPRTKSTKVPSPELMFQAIQLIESRKYSAIFKDDELSREMRYERAFPGFVESPPTFAPTFKVQRNEISPQYTNQRLPAYCDRILHRSIPGFGITQLSFKAANEIVTSDHKPVSAEFSVEVFPKPIISESRSTVSLRVTNLRGSNLLPMDITGASDPYIKFAGKILKHDLHRSYASLVMSGVYKLCGCAKNGGKTRSKYITQNLNPTWDDNDIPLLKTTCSTVEDLKDQHLIVIMRDWDQVGADDNIGNCVLPLRLLSPSFEEKDEHFDLDATVSEARPFDRLNPSMCSVERSGPRQLKFCLNLTHCGIPSGTIEGNIEAVENTTE